MATLAVHRCSRPATQMINNYIYTGMKSTPQVRLVPKAVPSFASNVNKRFNKHDSLQLRKITLGKQIHHEIMSTDLMLKFSFYILVYENKIRKTIYSSGLYFHYDALSYLNVT